MSGAFKIKPDQRNWPAEVSGSLSQATTTTSAGSITAHPVSRSSRTKPSGRTWTPVSFLVPVVLTPTWPTLLTIIAIEPDLPMSGRRSSQSVSPVIGCLPICRDTRMSPSAVERLPGRQRGAELGRLNGLPGLLPCECELSATSRSLSGPRYQDPRHAAGRGGVGCARQPAGLLQRPADPC